MASAPYDDRNQADYQENTRKIEAALELIRKHSTIEATQKSLTALSGCSRGTLYHRKYPLECLKEIKRQRSEKKSKPKSSRISPAYRVDIEDHLRDKKDLEGKLDKSRNETAIWVKKCLELEREVKRISRLKDSLSQGKKFLERKVAKLKKTIAEMENNVSEEAE